MSDLEVSWVNDQQRDFYYAIERNQCFSGGFNNGKSFSGCLKVVTLAVTFSKYRTILARNVRSDLMKTTFETFKKILPAEFIEAQNLQEGFLYLKNGSRFDLLHLDKVEESTLRGFEVNSVLTDQAEEVAEETYDILDARIGRWDQVEIPTALLHKYPQWPRHEFTGKYIVPSYHLNLCNPDTQFHHLYRHYHPDSPARLANHFFVEGAWDYKLGSVESYKLALAKGPEFVEKYVLGKWGISKAQIHRVWPDSLIEPNEELLDQIRRKGNLYRILDHGDASPTSCLWFAVLGNIHVCYREYYAPNKVISEHRQAINDLSAGESYAASYADPSIFRKTAQKDGGFWTVSDEYSDSSVKGPPLYWLAADNNEYATRNRINELLKPNVDRFHPITKDGTAPGIYFIKRTVDYPNGCVHAIKELGSQRRKLLGYFEGEAIYTDDREDSVADHAYDCIRYYVAMHGKSIRTQEPKPKPNTIKFYKELMKRHKANHSISPASSY